MKTRRSFLKESAIYGAGLALLPTIGCAAAKRSVGLQLYTLRDIIGKDLKGTIAKVAAAGYNDVETFGYSTKNGFFGTPLADFNSLLRSHNLTSSSGHYGFNKLFATGDLSEVKLYIDAAQELNSTYVTIPWIDEWHRKSLDDYKRHADSFNKAGELCKQSGLKLGYHNHDFEFKKWGDQTGFDILLKDTDKDLVAFEMDIYWVVRSGQDPVKLFEQYKGRFPLWHVKDMDKTNRDWNTEIGKGQIDFKNLFKYASAAGLKHAFVEQETNYKPDIIGSINKSADFFAENFNK